MLALNSTENEKLDFMELILELNRGSFEML